MKNRTRVPRDCAFCGAPFMARIDRDNRFCTRRCAGKDRNAGTGNPMWKGGRVLHSKGYVMVWMPGHPMAHAGGNGIYVFEHRLVMAEHLGRLLTDDEVVHHKNRNRQDNRLSNLQLMTQAEHTALHQALGEEAWAA